MSDRTFQSHILSSTDSSIPITVTQIRVQIAGEYPLTLTEDNTIYIDQERTDEEVIAEQAIKTHNGRKNPRVEDLEKVFSRHPRNLQLQTSDSGTYLKTDLDVEIIYTVESPDFVEPIYVSKMLPSLSTLNNACFASQNSVSKFWSIEERLAPVLEFTEHDAELYANTKTTPPTAYIGSDTDLLTLKSQRDVSQLLANPATAGLTLLAGLTATYFYLFEQSVVLPAIIATSVLGLTVFSGSAISPRLSGTISLTDPAQDGAIVFSSDRETNSNFETVTITETDGQVVLESTTTDESWPISTTDPSTVLTDQQLELLYDLGFENVSDETPVTVAISSENPKNKPAIELETEITEGDKWVHSAN